MSFLALLGKLSPMRYMEWGHTELYHPFLLRHVPNRAKRALDVGCGTGLFARQLATRVDDVDAIDVDDEALTLARERSETFPNIRFANVDLMNGSIENGVYDFVSCLMCIHHMPFEPAIERLVAVTKPGGTLAILGLGSFGYRELPLAIAILPLDMAMGIRFKVAKWLGRPSLAGVGPEAPVAGPTMRVRDIRARLAELLPEGVFRRHIFYRYSFIYRKP